ncbi:LysR family transcriptional regulator [Mesorhizobium escarrei]|uniref:DNA-binding transcriptional regulator, LysR family n=1 Tax=Mesorhizobium escarrei TaxID=666018 RepID=A0ABM9EIP6_9HYPH|nr:LysR family transcriptional regulator [Mesorhizobium escarrei]CAH2408809.1 DNA-binding transcriptional regulator, LysR family [Mesorhizobium escarrei]
MDTFSTMRAFRRIVELGGLARAAEDLGLSSAGLSKQLRALEAHLDTVLLQRTTRSMSLTESGRAYYADCCRILDELDVLEQSMRQQSQRVTGRLRLNAPLSFTLSILSPLLAEFLRDYPDLQLDLVMEDRLIDAVAHGFDLSIRLRSSLDDSTLIARRLATVKQVLCAAPSYLEQNGEPATLDDLRRHKILIYSLAQIQDIVPMQENAAAGSERSRINNSLLLRDMLVAGLGIGALPSFLADPAIARGELRRILPAFMDEPRHVYAVYPTSRHLQPKVKAFVEFLGRRLPSVMNDYS